MVRLLPAGWSLIGTADFNGDGKPDYLLYQREHAPNSDLVHEQQRFRWRCLRSDSSDRLEPGRALSGIQLSQRRGCPSKAGTRFSVTAHCENWAAC